MQLEATYDDWADTYGRMYSGPDWPISEASISIGYILRKKIKIGRVLEVGCGIGFVTSALVLDGFDVLGIDISARSVERAQGLLDTLNVKANVEKCDILEFADDKPFDAVVAVGSLLDGLLSEDDQIQALKRMTQSLRPGGYVVIGLHDYEKRIEREPDIVVQPAYRCVHADGDTLNVRVREWGKRPRDRIHVDTFYQVCNGSRLVKATITSRAMFHGEVTKVLTDAGMEDIQWHEPERTGYYQPLCVARKKENLTLGEQGDKQVTQPIAFRKQASVGNQTKPLVLWSGGLDSTYCLHQILSKSTETVYVHHVAMSLPYATKKENETKRIRTEKLLELFERDYPQMTYSQSAIDISSLTMSADNRMIAVYFGAQAAMTARMCEDTQIVLGLSEEESDDWGSNSAGFWRVRQLMKCIMRSEEHSPITCPSPPVSRQAELEALPSEMKMLFLGNDTKPMQ